MDSFSMHVSYAFSISHQHFMRCYVYNDEIMLGHCLQKQESTRGDRQRDKPQPMKDALRLFYTRCYAAPRNSTQLGLRSKGSKS